MEKMNGIEDETVWRLLASNSSSSSRNNKNEIKNNCGVILGNGLCDLEADMRCTICGEFYDIPVSLQGCFHTFCSECIGQHISTSIKSMKGKATCPICKVPTNSNKTTPNRTIAALVKKFQTIRGSLKEVLFSEISKQQTSKNDSPKSSTLGVNKHHEPIKPHGDHQGKDKKPRLEDFKPEAQAAISSNETSSSTEILTLRKPFPITFYKGMKKKKLQDLCKARGLSIAGTENQLRDRHQKFTMLYNSQCNSFTPMTQKEVAAEIHRRENAQKAEEHHALCNGLNAQVSHVQRLHETRKAAGKDDSVKITSGNKKFDDQFHQNFKHLIDELNKRTVRKPRRKWTEEDFEKYYRESTAFSKPPPKQPVSSTGAIATAPAPPSNSSSKQSNAISAEGPNSYRANNPHGQRTKTNEGGLKGQTTRRADNPSMSQTQKPIIVNPYKKKSPQLTKISKINTSTINTSAPMGQSKRTIAHQPGVNQKFTTSIRPARPTTPPPSSPPKTESSSPGASQISIGSTAMALGSVFDYEPITSQSADNSSGASVSIARLAENAVSSYRKLHDIGHPSEIVPAGPVNDDATPESRRFNSLPKAVSPPTIVLEETSSTTKDGTLSARVSSSRNSKRSRQTTLSPMGTNRRAKRSCSAPWACSVCTFINQIKSNSTCEICGTPRSR